MAQDTSMPAPTGAARRRPWLTQDRREELTAYLFISPWVIGFLVFTLGAMIFSLWLSFLDTDLLGRSQFVGPNNYVALFQDPLFIQSLKVTTLYTVLTVPLSTIIALLIALMLNQKILFPGVFRVIYYLPALVTGVAVTILWSWVLNPDNGLLNGFLLSLGVPRASLPRWFLSENWALPSLVLMSLWGVGAGTIIYLAGLQGIPTDLYEAAEVDGARGWGRFRHITLPLMTPVLFFQLIVGLIGALQVFTQAFITTNGGPNNATLFVLLYLYRNAFQYFRMGYASALAWVLFVYILVLTLVMFRWSAAWVYYEGELRKG